MEVKARLFGISKDLLSNKTLLTFAVDRVGAEVNDITEKDLRLIAKQWKKKRSLDANSYAWKLMTMLGQKTGVSAEAVYERFIQENPIFYEDEDGFDIRYLKKGKKMKPAEHEHWFFLKAVTVRDTKSDKECDLDVYAKLKGTSQYDTKEMSHFIEQVIYECKEHGIETMTPQEQQELLDKWGEQYA